MNPTPSPSTRWLKRGERLRQRVMRGFHRYASWLVGISWRRFVVLSLLLIILANLMQQLPPFSWNVTETIIGPAQPEATVPAPPAPAPKASSPTAAPAPTRIIRIERPAPGASAAAGVDISIDERGIRITPKPAVPAVPAVPATPAAPAASGAAAVAAAPSASASEVRIALPPGLRDDVREAIRDAMTAMEGAVRDATEAQRDAVRAAEEARIEAEAAAREAREEAEAALREAREELKAARGEKQTILRTRRIQWGDFLVDLALLWVLASAIIKITYKGRVQAEVKAAQATETAEAELLKRQVVEARMAAMQAQVEPHFLFNTLASIDHLIETDPARASQMQKNLIALLRASMPTMREANDGGARDLGRELTMVRPYLEILKVRMEERLITAIDVPDGLLSAEFPPMMIQTLVENSIKHGLEPKAEGGSLTVRAQIVHGKLQLSVSDTGLGFGKAATGGTGVGLANIRQRLQLLYGPRASLTIAENPGGGTIATITLPYKSLDTASA